MIRQSLVVIASIALLAGSALAEEKPVPEFDPIARQKPTPVITKLDDSIPDDRWVTAVVQVQKARAVRLVPIVRPLLPKNAHIVADDGSNKLLIVDAYGNVDRIVRIIRLMDVKAPSQPRD